MKLDLLDVSCGYGQKNILSNITFSIESRKILCILGPNGVGKSTLFKTILGFLELQHGSILLDGESISNWSIRRLAKSIAYVPQIQAQSQPFSFSVLEVVTMGRTAHLRSFESPSKKDIEIAESSLDRLEILFLKNRIFSELSGGERQMVLIARALTQQPQVLIMDEPTSNLDFGNQIKVLKQIKKLAQSGLCIVMTSHFPDHAFLCSANVVLLQKDKSYQTGVFDEVVTEENLRKAYGIDVKIIHTVDDEGAVIKACVPVLS
ncbi:MAG: ABC transporter ATP-binding protein [Selenomonadaceae bacterium]